MHNSVVMHHMMGKLRTVSMRKTFVSNLILLLSLNLLVKPAYLLFVEAEIQNRVGAEAFGNYFALINFSFLLNIIPDLGITNWNTRNIARHSHLLQRYFSDILSLRLLLAAAYITLALVFGWVLDYSSEQFTLLVVLAFNQVLASSILYLRSNLTGLHLFVQDSIVSVLDRSILMLLMAVLLWGQWTAGNQFRVEWLVWGQTAAYGITMITALWLVLRKSGKIKWTFSMPVNIAILRQSLPYALLIFTSMIAYRIDSVMLERMRPDGAHEAGVYAMGFRFYEAFNMIAYLFAVLLLPIFSRMLKLGQNVSDLTALAFKILFVGAWTVSVLCFFFGNHILALFYDHEIEAATPVFRWLMMACLCFSLQYVFGTLLTAGGFLKTLIWVSVAGMLLNIALNLWWIPAFGARGSAMANGITQLMILLLQAYWVMNKLKVWPAARLAMNSLLFAAFTGAVAWVCTIKGYPFAYSAVIVAVSALAIAVFTRMLDLARFLRLLRETH